MQIKAALTLILTLTLSSNSFAIYGYTYVKDLPENSLESIVSIYKWFQEKDTLICSGTVLSDTQILTAAHCYEDLLYTSKVLYKDSFYDIHKIYIHKNYTYEPEIFWGHVLLNINVESDLAIITLKEPLKDAVYATLQKESEPITQETQLLASGFGRSASIFGLGKGEGVLRTTRIMKVSHLSKERLQVNDGSTGVCPGDSGGPLWVLKENHLVQAGITSQGDCSTFSWFERVTQERLDLKNFELVYPKTN